VQAALANLSGFCGPGLSEERTPNFLQDRAWLVRPLSRRGRVLHHGEVGQHEIDPDNIRAIMLMLM